MKIVFLGIFTLFISVLSAGCSNEDHSSEQSSDKDRVNSVERMSEDVRLNADVVKTEENRLLVTGGTNLPNEANLVVTLSNNASGGLMQGDATVRNRQFSAGPLGPMSGVVAGEYTLEITMPTVDQPERVQSVLGDEGQYLSGPLVRDSGWAGKIVKHSSQFTVGSREDVKKAQAEHAKLVSNVESTIDRLLKKGRDMERYRHTEDLSDLETCGNLMRKYQNQAKDVQSIAQTLPMKYLSLRQASIEVSSCVSCSEDAMKTCERISKSLDDNTNDS